MRKASAGTAGAVIAVSPVAGNSTIRGSNAHVLGSTGTMWPRALAAMMRPSRTATATRTGRSVEAELPPRNRDSGRASVLVGHRQHAEERAQEENGQGDHQLECDR